jgi:Chaperone of endosialidase
VNALHSNTTGSFNTADGLDALYANTSGFSNVGIGANAGRSLTGSGNVCIGVNVYGVAGESNTTRIKNVYSSIASGRAVYVNSDNKIGTLSSSRRFKEEIKPMEQVSEALFALKPVTFRYKKEIDPNGTKQFGLVAEEVARVDPVLLTRDGEGKPETVRYEAVNAMLLNEFLKEHQKVEEQGRELQGQKAINAELRSTIAQQQKDIKALVTRQNDQDAKIERVNAKVELAKPQPEVVENR